MDFRLVAIKSSILLVHCLEKKRESERLHFLLLHSLYGRLNNFRGTKHSVFHVLHRNSNMFPILFTITFHFILDKDLISNY